MKQKTYRTALFGLLAALAAALSYLEGLLPTAAFLPPGAKPGFSNLVNLFAASFMGTVPALGIALLKACFAGLTRGGTAFFMSLCGGTLSTLLMCLLLKRTRRLSFIGIGIAGAVCHGGGAGRQPLGARLCTCVASVRTCGGDTDRACISCGISRTAKNTVF